MTRTVVMSFTLSFVIATAWAAQIVCYREQAPRLDPLAPITYGVGSMAAHDR